MEEIMILFIIIILPPLSGHHVFQELTGYLLLSYVLHRLLGDDKE